ncbi:hypothetical protein Tco_1091446 [Tanacetum coccineum]|uniref:Uncharacterized protein n=1 Tax=Tanacetum coccineum TaxID=301880 RepID=A0ABQ5I730_9ASTR
MDLEQNNSLAKLSLLKQEEGNSFKPVAQTTREADGTSITTIPGAVTHLLTFNKHKDAKSLFEAIEARFGGNEATKKTQKTLLKQMYETFSASSSESLDSIFNRLQKIVSQLTILGEIITPEELNLKFLRSLPTEWGMHVVVWRNKSDLGSISFDDLYNNFKIVEPEVKRSVTSSSNSGSQNLAFVSGHSSTNDGNTANVHVSTGSSPVSTASTNNSTACLSDATVYAYLATQPNGSQVVHEDLDQIHEDDDLLKLIAAGNQTAQEDSECEEAISLKAMLAIDDLKTQYDKLRVELRKSESDLSNYKRGLASVEERLVFYKKNESMLNDQIVVLKRDASYKDSDINGWNNLIAIQILYNNKKGLRYNVVPPPLPSVDLSSSGIEKFKEPEFEGYGVKMKVLNSPYFMVKSWLVQDQTVLGQTATGKESSNPFMAGSLPKTISPMIHISQEVILLKEERTGKARRSVKTSSNSSTTKEYLISEDSINMLVDKKYPLKNEILKKMINLKIKAEEESDMASKLIKFIKSQIAEQS